MARELVNKSHAKAGKSWEKMTPWAANTIRQHKAALKQTLFLELVEDVFRRAEGEAVIRVNIEVVISNNIKLKCLLLAVRSRRLQVAGRGKFINAQ
ncbi:MAG: hypothetical protein HQK62_14075 [Desulfamplus sp.]|nr:hypothetical protein [Desulfamplus sp.]